MLVPGEQKMSTSSRNQYPPAHLQLDSGPYSADKINCPVCDSCGRAPQRLKIHARVSTVLVYFFCTSACSQHTSTYIEIGGRKHTIVDQPEYLTHAHTRRYSKRLNICTNPPRPCLQIHNKRGHTQHKRHTRITKHSGQTLLAQGRGKLSYYLCCFRRKPRQPWPTHNNK